MSIEKDKVISQLSRNGKVFSMNTGDFGCDGSGARVKREGVIVKTQQPVGKYFLVCHDSHGMGPLTSFVGCRYFREGGCSHPAKENESCDRVSENVMTSSESEVLVSGIVIDPS